MSVLSVTAGLLLVLSFYIRILSDRLSESDLRRIELDIDLIALFQLALDDLELLLTDTVDQGLAVRGVIDDLKCIVFRSKLGKRGSDLILITLLDSLVSLDRVRSRKLCSGKRYRVCLDGQRVMI